MRWGRTRLRIRRRLSDVRVAPGTRVTVRLDVENEAPVPSPFLLIEDRLPATLGRPARLVVSGLPGKTSHQVGYTVLPQTRGRYRLGPLTVDVSDPFALTRQRLEFDEVDDLLVTPEIEDLFAAPDSGLGPNWGATRARQLFRTGEEYYTMRQYQLGDDLRRIHWPSVARTGDLMIRQDESSRRASGLVFLDNRGHALGQSHSPAFERAVSVAATLGVLLAQRGFSLRLGTTEAPPATVSEERFLDALAGISPRLGALGRSLARPPAHRRLGRHLARLRGRAAGARRAHLVDPSGRRLRARSSSCSCIRSSRAPCPRRAPPSSRAGPPRRTSRSPARGGTASCSPPRPP